MPDIDPQLREEIDQAVVDFWQSIEAQNLERKQPGRPAPMITTECATLDNRRVEREIPEVSKLPPEEPLEFGFEFVAAPVSTEDDDYGPPVPSPIWLTRAVFMLTTSGGVTADVIVKIDGVSATFNTGTTSLAVPSNTLTEFTADPGQICSTDILFSVTAHSPDGGSSLDMVLYGYNPIPEE